MEFLISYHTQQFVSFAAHKERTKDNNVVKIKFSDKNEYLVKCKWVKILHK